MISLVFFNIVNNAVRHRERVTAIAIGCKSAPNGLVITVEDNSTGIPADLKESVFDKGYGKNLVFRLFHARGSLQSPVSPSTRQEPRAKERGLR